jgi:type I restriction enzyme M protein
MCRLVNEATDVPNTVAYSRRQNERYGDEWRSAHAGVVANRGKSILSLYQVGEGRGGSKTEILFLERCLDLLKPGGRLAIVLPNGNLNGASLSWLRRWAEGKAFLRGVVALPMETFRFSGASVSASVVFMQKFTDAHAAQWEAAWAEADTNLAPEFAQRRAEKAALYATAVIDGGDDELKQILIDLRALGGDRVLPELTHTAPTVSERGAGTTTISSPRWTGPSRGEAASLRRKYAERTADVPAIDQALADLKAELAKLDDEQTKAMWRHVREAFDYPVFMARPPVVGITATGDTGEHVPNDLPEVLAEWKAFIASLKVDGAA